MTQQSIGAIRTDAERFVDWLVEEGLIQDEVITRWRVQDLAERLGPNEDAIAEMSWCWTEENHDSQVENDVTCPTPQHHKDAIEASGGKVYCLNEADHRQIVKEDGEGLTDLRRRLLASVGGILDDVGVPE